MMRFLWLALAFVFAAAPAHAAPLAGLVSAVSGVFTALSGSAIGSFLLRTVASYALNALANALIGKPKQSNPGIRTDSTTAGGSLPQTMIFGRYATGGNAVCPPMTHGTNGKTVDYLTYVIDLADYPIESLDAVFVNAEKQTFTTPGNLYGKTATGTRFANKAWLRWHDGRQGTADDMLVEVYSNYPDRPWSANHILHRVAYAVLTFKYDADEFQGMPECLFELRGARLYDPRKDSTVGGVGGHRTGNSSTWEFTENPVVMIYNLLRGIPLADGSFYGLRVPTSGLPLDRWVAAMNACDEEVEVWGGTTEPRYRAGLEFGLDQEPLDVISTLLAACSGQIAECGGSWNISVGPAPLPRALFTDDDIIVSNDRDFQPFRGLAGTYNGAHATYPAPHALWKPKDAPPLYVPEWEAEDDNRRLTASLQLNAVTSGYQAQRLMREMVGDNRRMISHTLTLRPTALGLLPLDTVSWTSARNSYTSKLFEITAKTIDPETLNVTLQLRERTLGDYEFSYEETTPIDVINGPWNPVDGAPATGGTPPDGGSYGGMPVVRPTAVSADLVAVHAQSVSRSTDGGHTWLRTDAGFSGGQAISALRNEGFLVRTADGGAWYANRLTTNGWTLLDLKDTTESNVLANGSFENGLTGWTVVSGSPVAIESSNPSPVGGGRSILYGSAAFLLEQPISTAGLGAELRLEGSAWVQEGATARVGVRMPGLDGNGEYLPVGPSSGSIAAGTVIDSPFGDGLTLRITLLSTNGSVNYSASGIGLALNPGAFARYRAEVLGGGGTDYAIAFSGLGEGESIECFGALGYTLPTGSAVSAEQTATGFKLSGTSTVGFGDDASAACVRASGAFEFRYTTTIFAAFSVQPRPAADATTTRSVTLTSTPGWKPNAATAVVFVESLGGGRVWADDLKLNAGAIGGAEARAIARDLGGNGGTNRRHLAATATTLYAVAAPTGTLTSLGPVPFAPSLLAGDADTILCATEDAIAISTDGGATWTQHIAAAPVSQVFARPASCVLEDGRVYTVAVGGLTLQSSLGAPHFLARRRSRNDWLAASETGGVLQQGGLASWTSAPAMPTGSLAGYAVVPTDEGRVVGWRRATRDLFNLDEGAAAWTLSPPFSQTAFDLQEVR
jgi:hypothetical protein